MMIVNVWKIIQLIIYRSNGIGRALELMVKNELFPTDAIFLVEFRKCNEDRLGQKLINLCNHVRLTLYYYY